MSEEETLRRRGELHVVVTTGRARAGGGERGRGIFGEGQRRVTHRDEVGLEGGKRRGLKRGSENEIVKAARASTGDMYYYRGGEPSMKKEATRKGREGARQRTQGPRFGEL